MRNRAAPLDLVLGLLNRPSMLQGAAVALSLILFWSSALSLLARTTVGLHCPTAAVQGVKSVVYEKGCCGKLTAKVVFRKVTAEDQEFVQCRCVEKKAASAAETSRKELSPVAFAILSKEPEELSCSLSLGGGPVTGFLRPELPLAAPAPLIPPPRV
jgi:hypothetical protein